MQGTCVSAGAAMNQGLTLTTLLPRSCRRSSCKTSHPVDPAGTVGMKESLEQTSSTVDRFAVASATIEAIRRLDPPLVTIVAMGSEGRIRTDEDEQCALFMRNLLQGVTPDHESVRSLVLAGSEARKYGNPATPHFPTEDRDMAVTTTPNDFDIR